MMIIKPRGQRNKATKAQLEMLNLRRVKSRHICLKLKIFNC